MSRGFRDLIVWQRAMDFAFFVYKIADNLPAKEKFGLWSQITRAAISIPANIAEGYVKSSRKDFCRFLQISLGSSAEVETYIELMIKLGYISSTEYEKSISMNDEVRRMLRSFIQKTKE